MVSGTRHVARATGSVHAEKASTAVAGTRTVPVVPRPPSDAPSRTMPSMLSTPLDGTRHGGDRTDRYASALPMSASTPIMDSMRARELR